MNRLTTTAHNEAIGAALGVIPPAILERLRHVEFLTGVDPIFAGLHTFEDCSFGRSYRETAHCAYPWHTSDRTTTIVLPVVEQPWVITHELGHALDEILGFSAAVIPVTDYAGTNRNEAFAESFTAWLWWYGDQDALGRDEATRALFAGLVA